MVTIYSDGFEYDRGDRVILPRRTNGVDWGSVRWLLARHGTKELWWLTSGKEWFGLMEGYQLRPGQLIISLDPGKIYGSEVRLHEGGRLSKNLLYENAKAIDEYFGCDVSRALHPKHTVVVKKRVRAKRGPKPS